MLLQQRVLQDNPEEPLFCHRFCDLVPSPTVQATLHGGLPETTAGLEALAGGEIYLNVQFFIIG